MKYAWIDAQRGEFDLRQMCEVLEVSVSGYRAWKRGGTPDRKRLTDAQLLALIHAIHAEVKRAYRIGVSSNIATPSAIHATLAPWPDHSDLNSQALSITSPRAGIGVRTFIWMRKIVRSGCVCSAWYASALIGSCMLFAR